MARTTNATIREIESSPLRGVPAKTIFFGGGTPTFLPAEQLTSLLRTVMQVHPPQPGAELTSEANPGTVDAERFAAMHEAGFNRISLGAQSFLEEDLVRLGRVHRSGHIERAVSAARDAGFRNINVDLMFALPGQSTAAWKTNLDRALALGTEHLSLYGLTIEPNTAFYKQQLKGQLLLPEEEEQVSMYNLALECTAEAGFLQYEISNFARAGQECQHNLCYWRGEHYAGYGPGAVGYIPTAEQSTRYTNKKHPELYCNAIESGDSLWCDSEVVTPELRRIERLMLGLRLNEGVDYRELDLDSRSIEKLEQRGWANRDDVRLRLTNDGKHFCSEVTLALV